MRNTSHQLFCQQETEVNFEGPLKGRKIVVTHGVEVGFSEELNRLLAPGRHPAYNRA